MGNKHTAVLASDVKKFMKPFYRRRLSFRFKSKKIKIDLPNIKVVECDTSVCAPRRAQETQIKPMKPRTLSVRHKGRSVSMTPCSPLSLAGTNAASKQRLSLSRVRKASVVSGEACKSHQSIHHKLFISVNKLPLPHLQSFSPLNICVSPVKSPPSRQESWQSMSNPFSKTADSEALNDDELMPLSPSDSNAGWMLYTTVTGVPEPGSETQAPQRKRMFGVDVYMGGAPCSPLCL